MSHAARCSRALHLLLLVAAPAGAELAWHAASFPSGDQPFDLVAVDLDDDGDVDLAVTDSKADTVSVLLNDGRGGFAARVALPSGRFPRGIAAADLNRDGHLDLAIAATNAGAVAIHDGLGSGRFAPMRLVPSGGVRPFHLAAADLDGDGDVDLVVPNESQPTTVLLNDGAGAFRLATYDTGTRPSNVAVDDWNGDGRPDLAVTNWGSNTIALLFAAGAPGAFAAPRPLSSDGRGLFGIAAGDLDRDGHADLLCNDIKREAFQLFYGDGRGGFPRTRVVPAGPGVRSVRAEDLDGDGWRDLASADTAGGCVSVALADGRGGFGATQQLPAGSKPRVVRVADLDGDGRLDLVVTNMDSDSVTVLFNRGRAAAADAGLEVGPPLSARNVVFTGLDSPAGLALAPDGAVLVADQRQHRVARLPAGGGDPITVAGTGIAGFSGDGGPAALAQLAAPAAVAAASDGTIYIADFDNHRIRRIDARGVITTVAGTGEPGISGDGGPAAGAQLMRPFSLALAPDGALFIAELQSARVRRIGVDGRIATVAGSGAPGSGGDGGPATAAQLGPILTIAVDSSGTLLIADLLNGRLRAVDRVGVIRTSAADLTSPSSIAADPRGGAVLATRDRVARIDSAGALTTIRDLVGLRAGPPGLAVTADGSIHISDPAAHTVRTIP